MGGWRGGEELEDNRRRRCGEGEAVEGGRWPVEPWGRRPQDTVTLKGVNADWAEEAQRAHTHVHARTHTPAAEEPDWF